MLKLSAKPVAEKIQSELSKKVQVFTKQHHRSPQLAVILVGDDPASVIYTRKKGEAASNLGMRHQTLLLPVSTTPSEVKKLVAQLNQDPDVDGILIQRPLPPSFIEEEVLYWIDPRKDVDAFHPDNAGRLFLGLPTFLPCTPAGVMELLKHYQIDPARKLACVVGRSSIVGKPMAALLLNADATVLHCHSKTPDLKRITRMADILVVAVGKPGFIDSSFVAPRAVVIDVGIHKNAEGKTVGDVVYEDVAPVASAITPVPGGVGPMTIAILMQNTFRAASLGLVK